MNNFNGKTGYGDPGREVIFKQLQCVNIKWDQKLVHSVIGAFFIVCPTFDAPVGPTPASADVVLASWYGPGFHGRRTANGERFNQWAMTAAHKSLPFGTKVRVTHRGKSVTVRINDRGPFIRGRSLDLSKGAARRIGCAGVCRVHMVVVGRR